MTFYPNDKDKEQKLPNGKNYGRIQLQFVCSYYKSIKFSSHIETNGNPIMFIDIEHPPQNAGYKRMKQKELHFGISGNFIELPNIGDPKPHIDIFFSLNEIDNLISNLNKIKLDRNMGLL